MCLYCIAYKYIIQYIEYYNKYYFQEMQQNQWFLGSHRTLENGVLRKNYRELQFISQTES